MDSQKRENLLNLALETSEEERNRSVELQTGYNDVTGLWEVIVRYVNDIGRLRDEGIEVVELLGNYAILRLTREQLLEISADSDITYIEVPKRLFFGVQRGKEASCILPLQISGGDADMDLGRQRNINTIQQASRPQLYGAGVFVGLADSGIDILHPAFRYADGSTRIIRIWDQTKEFSADGRAPFDYMRGREYTREEINEMIAAYENGRINRNELPCVDVSGHGTAVAAIAAGSDMTLGESENNAVSNVGEIRERRFGRNEQNTALNGSVRETILGRGVQGVAPESDIVVVKLGISDEKSFPRTTELMMAVDYLVRTALELGNPIAINISIGNTYGSHDGTALLETYLEAVADIGRNVIVIGAGNEGNAGGHTEGVLQVGIQEEVELAVALYETKLSLQIWKYYADIFEVSIEAPDGTIIGPFGDMAGAAQYNVGQTKLLVYYGAPKPYESAQEIYIEFISVETGGYIGSGIWTVRINPISIVEGTYHMWLPDNSGLNLSTRFLNPTPDVTLTVPSTASKVITVGAYDAARDTYGDFSGRGFTRVTKRIKPELVAPGVDVTTARVGGGTTVVTGTSFAAPFVTGAAALLMEWGIVKGNDAFLYGEKVKAYLIRGARQLPGEETPSRKTGWGALCVTDSIPKR